MGWDDTGRVRRHHRGDWGKVIQLRPYQVDGIERTRHAMRSGKRRTLIVSPTGSGKTVLAASLIEHGIARGSTFLFVAHRRELITQCVAKLRDDGIPEEKIGIVMAGLRSLGGIGAPVQVASIDTLRNRGPLQPAPSVIMIDEAHRARAQSYKDLIARYPDAFLVGLTATPFRADKSPLGDIFDSMVVVTSPRQLVDDGHLVEPKVWTVPAALLPDLRGVRTRAGDYDQRQLAAAADKSKLVGSIVEHWTRHAGGRRTVAFAASVEHSRHIAAEFLSAGIPAEHLDGTTKALERDAILARLGSGETLVVSNCGVGCEGWDPPAV